MTVHKIAREDYQIRMQTVDRVHQFRNERGIIPPRAYMQVAYLDYPVAIE